MRKKDLEIVLSKTPDFHKPKEFLEQYITPSRIAADLLWEAYMRGDISEKTILDLGCGTLRLGIGALFLGARRVIGVDIDCETLYSAYKWLARHKISKYFLLICADVEDIFLTNIDTVLMNPPFGVKKHNRGLDMVFLKKALGLAGIVYTMHKTSKGERVLVKQIAEAYNSKIVFEREMLFPVKMVFSHHRRRVYKVKIDVYAIRRATGERNEARNK